MTDDTRPLWDGDPELAAAVEEWAEFIMRRIARVPHEFPDKADWRRVWNLEHDSVAEVRKRILRALLTTYAPFSDFDAEDVGNAMACLVADVRGLACESGWEPHRAAISSRLRTVVYRRDGYACIECREDDITRLSVDHRVPVALGGGNEPDNLRTLCKSCNSRKGAAV